MPFPLSQNMLRRQEELENGTAWSLSSESSDDSSSPQLSGTARHSSAPKPLVQQPEPLPIQVAFRRPETLTSGPTDKEGAVGPALANGHALCSRTLSHISEASVDAALAEASVEAKDLESQGPSPSTHPSPTHGEHPGPVPPALDLGHSATSPILSTTGPAHTPTDPTPPVHLDSLHKATDSSSPELPGPTNTTISSTCSAISPTSSAPSLTHSATGPTHKPKPSTLTATGPTPSAMDPGETTTSPTHEPMLSTLTTEGPTPNTTSRVETTTSPSHTVTNLTSTVTSPTIKPTLSTLTTTGPTQSATAPDQPSSLTHTTSPTHTTASPAHKVSTPTTTSPTPSVKGPVQTTRSPTHSVTSPTLISVSPSTSLDLGMLPSSSAHTGPTLPGTDTLSCSHPASTPNTQADPIAPSTSYPNSASTSWEPLKSPSPEPPEPTLQSPSPTASPPAPTPQQSDLSLVMAAQAPVLGAAGGAGDRRLEEALGALMAALDDYRGQFPELQGLEQEVTRLESLLMVRRAGLWQHTEGSQAVAAALTPFEPPAETRSYPQPGLQS